MAQGIVNVGHETLHTQCTDGRDDVYPLHEEQRLLKNQFRELESRLDTSVDATRQTTTTNSQEEKIKKLEDKSRDLENRLELQIKKSEEKDKEVLVLKTKLEMIETMLLTRSPAVTVNCGCQHPISIDPNSFPSHSGTRVSPVPGSMTASKEENDNKDSGLPSGIAETGSSFSERGDVAVHPETEDQ